MPRLLDEPVAESPLWLEIAGYPQHLNERIRREAWVVFKKLVELDCAVNARPEVFTISLDELSSRVGLDSKIVERVVKGLRKEKLLRFYLPDEAEEEAMFQFVAPFRPPMSVEQIRERLSEQTAQRADRLRYIDESNVSEAAADNLVQQVVDAYLNAFGLRVNSFVLDELALLARRFPVVWIENAFARAAQMKRPSLRWAVQQLVARRRGESESDKEQPS